MEEFRVDPTIAYDVVELPSRGIHYQNKKKSLKLKIKLQPQQEQEQNQKPNQRKTKKVRFA